MKLNRQIAIKILFLDQLLKIKANKIANFFSCFTQKNFNKKKLYIKNIQFFYYLYFLLIKANLSSLNSFESNFLLLY